MNNYDLDRIIKNVKTNYGPPVSMLARLAHISYKRKRFALGAGFRRWAFNTINATKQGSMWAMKYCHIKTYKAHDFLIYKINYLIRQDVEVLEKVGSVDETGGSAVKDKELADGLRACMGDIGIDLIMLEPGEAFTDYEISRALQEIRRWMWSQSGISVIKDHTRWGHLMRNGAEVGDALFRYKMGGGYHYKNPYEALRQRTLSVSAKKLTECIGCGMDLPCVAARDYVHGQMLCNHCTTSVNSMQSQECKHVECGLFDCVHFIESPTNDTFDFVNDPGDDSEWMDDDLEHDFEF